MEPESIRMGGQPEKPKESILSELEQQGRIVEEITNMLELNPTVETSKDPTPPVTTKLGVIYEAILSHNRLLRKIRSRLVIL